MAEDSANAESVYLSPRVADLCLKMSKLSLQENSPPSDAGDMPHSKVQQDAIDPAGTCNQVEEQVVPLVERAEVIDEAGDAGPGALNSDPTGTDDELDEEKEVPLAVPDGTADGDLQIEQRQYDLATVGPSE